MLVLHVYEISPFCDKIRRALNYKRVSYEVREVKLSRALIDPRRVNPVGKLPTIQANGETIADSTNIVLWLEQRFPEPALLPTEPHASAQCHVLEEWADESLYFYEMTVRLAWRHNAARWLPDALRAEPRWFQAVGPRLLPVSIARKARIQGIAKKAHDDVVADIERHVSAIDALLGDGDWLVGPALTIADIAVFAQMTCIAMSEEGAGALAGHDRVRAWLQRVDAATVPAP